MIALPLRVFNRKTGVMTYLPPLMPIVNPLDGVCIGVCAAIRPPQTDPVHAAAMPSMQMVNPSDFVIMHATGFHDMTHQMLFEGDVCEGDFAGFTDMVGIELEGIMSMVRRRGVIVWSTELCGFTMLCDGKELDDFYVQNLIRLGNIWQNRDLIKQPPQIPVALKTDGKDDQQTIA